MLWLAKSSRKFSAYDLFMRLSQFFVCNYKWLLTLNSFRLWHCRSRQSLNPQHQRWKQPRLSAAASQMSNQSWLHCEHLVKTTCSSDFPGDMAELVHAFYINTWINWMRASLHNITSACLICEVHMLCGSRWSKGEFYRRTQLQPNHRLTALDGHLPAHALFRNILHKPSSKWLL